MVTVEPAPISGKIDLISRDAMRGTITELLERNLAAWSVMGPIEWVEQVCRIPDEHGATKRQNLFTYAPYTFEMYSELFNPRNQENVYQVYSRGLKTTIILSAIGYIIHQRPCPIGVMWPTLGLGKKWSKNEFTRNLIEPNPPLLDLVGDGTGRRRSDNTVLFKLFPGGLINIAGANVAGDLRQMKFRFGYADEVDAIQDTETDEGDQLAIFKKRGAEFPDTTEAYSSYPSLKRKSKIEKKLLSSDYRQWFVTCLLCGGEPYVMHRSQLRYDRDKPQDARIECPRCGGLLNDAQRYAMMMGGDPKKPRFDLWKATREFTGKCGFQANSLLWPHPVVDEDEKTGRQKFTGFLHKLAQREIDVETADNPERERRTLVNMDDAETYEAEFEHKPEHTALFLRREEYDPQKMLPAGVLAIFFFVDVQGDRLELFIDGYGQKNQTWALDYQVIKGTPLAPPDQGCWAELDRLLSQTSFQHPSGHYLRPAGGLIDCGYKPDHIFAFTRSKQARKIFASRGATTLSKPLIGRRAKKEGNPPAKVWEIGTNEAKDIIYQRLDLDNASANGYQHFPKLGQFSEYYFQMLVAEDSEMKRAGDGKFYRWFFAEEGLRNEALDGRVGTMAAERICKPNYKKLSELLAPKTEAGERTEPSQPPPSAPQRPIARPAPFSVRTGINRRSGGFVRGW